MPGEEVSECPGGRRSGSAWEIMETFLRRRSERLGRIREEEGEGLEVREND